jgi:hypothetical protein
MGQSTCVDGKTFSGMFILNCRKIIYHLSKIRDEQREEKACAVSRKNPEERLITILLTTQSQPLSINIQGVVSF